MDMTRAFAISFLTGLGAYAGIRFGQFCYGALRVKPEPMTPQPMPFALAPCECPKCKPSAQGAPERLRAQLSELESVERDARSAQEHTRELLARYDGLKPAPEPTPAAPSEG